jgi:hypothetical protein
MHEEKKYELFMHQSLKNKIQNKDFQKFISCICVIPLRSLILFPKG